VTFTDSPQPAAAQGRAAGAGDHPGAHAGHRQRK